VLHGEETLIFDLALSVSIFVGSRLVNDDIVSKMWVSQRRLVYWTALAISHLHCLFEY